MHPEAEHKVTPHEPQTLVPASNVVGWDDVRTPGSDIPGATVDRQEPLLVLIPLRNHETPEVEVYDFPTKEASGPEMRASRTFRLRVLHHIHLAGRHLWVELIQVFPELIAPQMSHQAGVLRPKREIGPEMWTIIP